MNAHPGARHVRALRAVASELQREIRLDGCIQLGRTPFVDIPPAIGELAAADEIGELWNTRGIAQYMQIEDVVRLKRGISLELSTPITFSGLLGQQRGHCPVDDFLELVAASGRHAAA